ncbi:hypothetical protein G6F68_013055 [Rhizopus microsporus]|nr:hypothetical protein G6F68_013055 [Rhizopus microsporus]
MWGGVSAGGEGGQQHGGREHRWTPGGRSEAKVDRTEHLARGRGMEHIQLAGRVAGREHARIQVAGVTLVGQVGHVERQAHALGETDLAEVIATGQVEHGEATAALVVGVGVEALAGVLATQAGKPAVVTPGDFGGQQLLGRIGLDLAFDLLLDAGLHVVGGIGRTVQRGRGVPAEMRVRGPQHGQLVTTAVDAADVVEAIAAGRADRLPRVTGVVLQQAVVEAHAVGRDRGLQGCPAHSRSLG